MRTLPSAFNAIRPARITTAISRKIKLGLLHAAAYVNCRPKLKQQVADLLARFPAVRASLSRYARFAPAVATLVDEVVSVDRLTAKGRAIYADLVHRNFSKTK
ncbi:hypothetical protein [Burkholderia sp. Leaf177]|uniref:hypothetical protein n=1 Tax=Burkholderia sp. Leaf177 TaxID=1736287 RepID=UPI0006F31B9C|nr:hypothetical protein [Burkholderia sp. Leaf177]